MDGAETGAGIRYPFVAPPEPGLAVAVAEGVLWMRLPLPMALDHVNIYALDDGDGWTLIDTGFDTGKARAQFDALRAGPLAGRPIRRVIATHYHPDHIGMSGRLMEEGAELLATRTTYLLARMLVLDVQDRPSLQSMDFWRKAGMPADMLAARAAERPFNFADVVAPIPQGYTRIAEGQSLRMGGRTWDIRCGEGHAPEHATFWSRDDSLVLGGDQLLPSISANLGVYATEPMADPVGEWLHSCARMATFARDDHLVLPGHKLPFTGLPLRLRQMVENHEGALARLRDHLSEPRTATGCFLPLFKRDITGPEYGMALVEAVAHLNHLLLCGQTSRTLRADGAWLWQVGGTGAPATPHRAEGA